METFSKLSHRGQQCHSSAEPMHATRRLPRPVPGSHLAEQIQRTTVPQWDGYRVGKKLRARPGHREYYTYLTFGKEYRPDQIEPVNPGNSFAEFEYSLFPRSESLLHNGKYH